MIPAVGQGALAIETRTSGKGFDACKLLDHQSTRLCVTAERAVLAQLGGGCQVPLGAHATHQGHSLIVRARVVSPTDERNFGGSIEGPDSDPETLGKTLAQQLLNDGASEILKEVYGK